MVVDEQRPIGGMMDYSHAVMIIIIYFYDVYQLMIDDGGRR